MHELERYARLGLNVIPLVPRDKRPSVASWIAYQARMSTDAERALWWPGNSLDANGIAIVTGSVSWNLAVVDCDDMATADAVRAELPPTMSVRTGKGVHLYYFLDRPTRTVAFEMNGLRHHVKAEGGYVVAPPSIHPSGNAYAFQDDRDPTVLSAVALAQALERAGARTGITPDVQERPTGWVADLLLRRVAEGERHDAFAKLAGYLSTRLHMDETCAVMRLWMEANVDGFENMVEYQHPEAQVRQWYAQRD